MGEMYDIDISFH